MNMDQKHQFESGERLSQRLDFYLTRGHKSPMFYNYLSNLMFKVKPYFKFSWVIMGRIFSYLFQTL